MSWEKIREALGEGHELLGFVDAQKDSISTLQTSFNALEVEKGELVTKVNDIQTSRDKLKNTIREKTGLETLDSESLDNYLAGIKKGNTDESVKAEIDNWRNELKKTKTEYDTLKSEFTNYQRDMNTKDMISKYVNDESVAPTAKLDLESRLRSAMSYDKDNKPTFKNKDGSTMLIDGKPATMDDVFNNIRQDAIHLFKGTTKSGGSAGGNNSGDGAVASNPTDAYKEMGFN